MSDKNITDAIELIGAGLTTLVELAQAGGASDASEPTERPSSSKASRKKASSKKKSRSKKATTKKKEGPSVDDARKHCLELVEIVDEYGDEGEDGNTVFKELIGGLFEDCEKLSDLEALDEPGAAFQALMDAVTDYLAENYPEGDGE